MQFRGYWCWVVWVLALLFTPSHSTSTRSSRSTNIHTLLRGCHCLLVTRTHPSSPQIMVLLRIRTNRGTWKHKVQDPWKVRLSSVATQLCHDHSCRITHALSRDPNGLDVLNLDQSIHDLGLTREGDMIYCRVEETNPSVSSTIPDLGQGKEEDATSNRPLSTVEGAATTGPLVIDLLESDDDNDNHKDDIVQVSPPRAAVRKRSTSSSQGVADSTKKKTRTASTAGSATPPPSKSFQIVSYNIWFGPPDPDARQVYPQQRMAAICQELKSCHQAQNPLLFIGFQEMTPTLRDYLAPTLNSMGFRLCTQPLGGNGNGSSSSYGVGLAISKSLDDLVETKFIPFSDSCQGRGLLYVQTQTLLFATTHLESFLDAKEYDGSAPREAQMAQATAFCQGRMNDYPQLQMAMIAGDFNWDDERVGRGKRGPNRLLTDVVPTGWKDAGTPLDYTYDGKENPMLSGNLRRRFDRCIYYTADNNKKDVPMKKPSLQKLGMKAIPTLTWTKKNPWNGTTKVVPVAPSDHFGIAIAYEL